MTQINPYPILRDQIPMSRDKLDSTEQNIRWKLITPSYPSSSSCCYQAWASPYTYMPDQHCASARLRHALPHAIRVAPRSAATATPWTTQQASSVHLQRLNPGPLGGHGGRSRVPPQPRRRWCHEPTSKNLHPILLTSSCALIPIRAGPGLVTRSFLVFDSYSPSAVRKLYRNCVPSIWLLPLRYIASHAPIRLLLNSDTHTTRPLRTALASRDFISRATLAQRSVTSTHTHRHEHTLRDYP